MGLAQASMWTITWPRCASTRIVVGESYQELELKLGYTTEASDETYLGLTDEDFGRTPLARYPGLGCGSHGGRSLTNPDPALLGGRQRGRHDDRLPE